MVKHIRHLTLYFPIKFKDIVEMSCANRLKLVCFNFPFAFFSQLFFIQPAVRTLFRLSMKMIGRNKNVGEKLTA